MRLESFRSTRSFPSSTCSSGSWMVLMLRWWKEIFRIHICITIVIWLGMVESFLWQALLNHWNRDGTRGKILFFFAVSSTVGKMVFSYMLVLVGCMGWGITK